MKKIFCAVKLSELETTQWMVMNLNADKEVDLFKLKLSSERGRNRKQIGNLWRFSKCYASMIEGNVKGSTPQYHKLNGKSSPDVDHVNFLPDLNYLKCASLNPPFGAMNWLQQFTGVAARLSTITIHAKKGQNAFLVKKKRYYKISSGFYKIHTVIKPFFPNVT